VTRPLDRRSAPLPADEATWYKDAIIYEVRTRSFFDSNGDGVGDLAGLTSKLDYLQDLGVTAVWLLPFYPSPGRDDGYDISDYTGVHPDVGTLADFDVFLEEAHRRGLRVITELVLNHTSDQHPWFQRARSAKVGSPEREFYVWSPTPDRYKDARIIFKDFEPSNWTWDREGQAYYWHRFYAHQPDLNFENPKVHEALLAVVDYWLGKGVDGLRLDAVPYLYEEEGTSSENLPATHVFLKKLRAHVDARFSNRLLLAEANQWPEDAAAYFGQGDECHMNFHFPVMPRMFMSLHMEDRLPITDIFAQTPELHPSCQWALFLRNHDELTLEMVTDEERDYMYRAYAHQAAMRINLGIRRRFAPLVGNSRRKMELLNALLFSLPGTPVVYYGDEIGMGDNVYLGDRNGVRTPMQWNMDRNAGFSTANPQRLILPVVIDPEYHYESLNVENQQQNPTSLLWWTKRIIALRKRFAAFGRGTIEFLSPSNSRVLAYVRAWGTERILVVANLSRFVQYVELDLAKYAGATPVELFGKTRFPVVREAPYLTTLGPHGFYWFSLESADAEAQLNTARLSIPTFECARVDALLREPDFEGALASFLARRPWFGRRDRVHRAVRVSDVLPLGEGPASILIALVEVEYSDTEVDTYVLPLAWVPDTKLGDEMVLAWVNLRGEQGATVRGALVDAPSHPPSARALLDHVARGAHARGDTSSLVVSLEGLTLTETDARSDGIKVGVERLETTLRYGDRCLLKLFRRLEEGTSPELELGRIITKSGKGIVPRLEASVLLTRPRAEPSTLAIVHGFVPHVGTGWEYTLGELGRYYDNVLARHERDPPPPLPAASPLELVDREPPAIVSQMIGDYPDVVARLARRVAELHLLLGSAEGPAFAPERYTPLDRRSKYQALRNLTGNVLRQLRALRPRLPRRTEREAEALLSSEPEIFALLDPLLHVVTTAQRIRIHGALHLGHVLYTGKDFVLTRVGADKWGDLAARVRKRSPLRDLATLVRSLDFAALKVLLDPARVRERDVDAARPWAVVWTSWVSAAFLRGYLEATRGAPFVPSERGPFAVLFDAFVLERALYQLSDQLQKQPSEEAVEIPLLGITNFLASRSK
jgi:maltose alpha-D-glucosyltransferase / alpha-amylase